MIKIENVEVPGSGFDNAIRGMRNPMNSWGNSDSGTCLGTLPCHSCKEDRRTCGKNTYDHNFIVGPNDYDLMMRLCKAGTEHRKYLRMIVVYLDITAPLYWWKEFDTYKVGTVANSCSTMHKIAAKEFTRDDFSSEHVMCICDKETPVIYHPSGNTALAPIDIFDMTIMMLNRARDLYLQTKDKQYWWQMIQLLPTSYNQKRTIMLNYEVLANIYRQRKGHKLDEWNDFCAWIKTLPYSELITGEHNNDI